MQDNLLQKFLQGLVVKGAINTKQHCPVCLQKFSKDRIDPKGFFCPICHTRPTRYYVTFKALGIDFLYSDPKTGKVFETYSQSLDVLIALNREYKQHIQGVKKFKTNDWIPEKVKEKRIENICHRVEKNYEVEYQKGSKSKARYSNVRKALNFIKEYFSGTDIRDIDTEEIEGFYHWLLDKGYSSRYIYDTLTILKTLMLKYRKTDTPDFPTFTVVPVKEKQRLGLARELQILEHIPKRYGYKVAILMLLRTGMRISECVALKVKDLVDGIIYVDKAFSEGRLRLARKSGGSVTYRVTPELWLMIKNHIKDKNTDDFVFSINRAKPISTGRLYKVWKKACSDAKVQGISLQQATRHSLASQIAEEFEKKKQEAIARQLGHFNYSSQKNYIIN